VVRVRLDRKATSISLLVVIGVRADGHKVLLAIKSTVKGHQDRRAFSGLDDRVAAEARFFIGAPGARVVHVWVNGHDRRFLDLQPTLPR
jgi:hypothetical protein